jgi:hypothetical protein
MNNLFDVLLAKIPNLKLSAADCSLLKQIAADSRLAFEYGIIHPNDHNEAPELMVLPAQENWIKYLAPNRLLIVNMHIIINYHKVMDIILCKGAVQREIQLNVELSGVCNLQCHYCSLNSQLGNRGPNSFMTLQTLQSIFKKIIDNPLYKVNGGICFWNGGEPLLHPKFDEIVAYLSEKQKTNDYQYNFVLLTNATCLTDQKIKLIIDCGAFKEIIFSVDGGNAATFEKMRYPAKWSHVSARIHAFLNYRDQTKSQIKTRVNMIYDPQTDQFGLDEEFLKLLNRIDNIDQYYPQAECGFKPEDYLDRYQKTEGLCLWLLLRQYVILWDGAIGMCCSDLNGLLQLGSLNDFDLIYNGAKRTHYLFNMLKGKRSRLAGCSGCNLSIDASGIWNY